MDQRETTEIISALKRIAHALECQARKDDPNFRPDFAYAQEHRATASDKKSEA